ncbi:lysine transporter LysE [Pseudomonas daroniae]|uniref:Lysine transporter LysE n=1 Tax=Phytopseudomonas daroniae TaxID=2487519 RepID=A0A4V2KA66_9GAMM|nr:MULTISPECIES: LysE family translocator [Pseudomonas]TBU72008.1 lysine transporter LysE [Pseudomonas daroniae]TBU75856.1 lysine transporter LysE [Pseudomonas sp. FRB 228]TBU77355.1 lysine transporter LysE [Pseudomonas daroniae]TBU87132.1 lysine transporter LysE [Pseudomonas daroniae]
MIPLAMSAGPGNLMVATSGAQSGVRRSVLFIAGLDIAYFVISMLVGLGLYHTLMSEPALVWGLRVAGSIYIMWLGMRLLLRPMISTNNENLDLQFRDGVMVQLGNVQGLVMLLVMFSTFIPTGKTSSSVVLALSFALISLNFIAHLIWVSLGATIQKLLSARPELLRAQNAVFGLMLIAVAVWIFIRTDSL